MTESAPDCQCFGNVAGVLDAAVSDNRHVVARRRLGAAADRRDLRHADTTRNDAVVQIEPGPIPTLTTLTPA